jgi:hypothetical protein
MMLLRILRFVSLLCATLVLGLTLTHDLEIPGKERLSGAAWLDVQHSFYGGFAVVGGVSEILGLVACCAMLYLVRAQRVAFVLTLMAAIAFAGTLVLFAVGNNPLNQQIATLPATWQQSRDAWDRFHAVSSICAAVAFFALLTAILRDTPASEPTAPGSARLAPSR